jgi:hypothetical protein
MNTRYLLNECATVCIHFRIFAMLAILSSTIKVLDGIGNVFATAIDT